MRLLKFSSIRRKLLFWFLMVSTISLLLVLVINYVQLKDEIESSSINKLEAIRDLKVERLTDWFAERKGDLLTISGDYEIRELESVVNKVSISTEDEQIIYTCRDLLTKYLERHPAYKELFIINPKNGRILVSTKKSSEGVDKSGYDYFFGPMKSRKIYLKDIYYSSSLSELSMSYSIPIFCRQHNKQHLIGILVARVDLENSLYKILQDKVSLGHTGETFIVNAEGWALSKLRWHDNAPLNLKISAEPAIMGASGEIGFTKTKDYRNEKVLAAFTYISEVGWGFVCKQDLSELNEPIRSLLFHLLLIFLIALVVIFLISYSISTSISKPILAIGNAAKKMRLGDYNQRIKIRSIDELGDLSIGFNAMAKTIKSRVIIQRGLSEISEAMIGISSMNEFAGSILNILLKITSANMGAFYILNEVTESYEPFASVGADEELLKSFSAENPKGEFGNILIDKEIKHLKEIPANSRFIFQTVAGDIQPKEIVTIPLIAENSVIAVISLASVKKMKKDSIEVLNQAWVMVNTSYANLLSNERTRILADQLYKINQQLEVQSEELQDQAIELQKNSQELIEQNIELEVQHKQVEEANKLKTEFLSNMSHELRTPLNAILSLSGVLIQQTKNKLDEDENEYLVVIERNGKRLLELINNILDLSKIESGKMNVIPSKVSIESLVKTIKENLQTLAEKKKLEYILNMSDDLPVIETDESKLYQVIINIVGNAIKFTTKGKVQIDVISSKKDVSITVADTGPGIPQEMIPFIFDEFRQVDGTSSRRFEGTGLGLAIADKIIHILGGTIALKSELGKGSEFTIQIPVNWHKGKLGLYQFLTSTENYFPEAPLKSISETRILIVEDNQNSILQIKSVLKAEGYVIDLAQTGQEALDYMQNNIPDGIILDLMMPDIDGFEVLEKIRNTEKTKKIPVLILTAKDLTKEDLSRLSSNNIQQLIQKGDIDIEGLLEKIRKMLGYFIEKEKEEIKLLEENESDLNEEKDDSKILVIEDNPDNMITIKAILNKQFDLEEAYDGEEGIEKAILLKPDLILLDISLPKKDGYEVIRSLKENDETKNIGIIVVTAQAMKGAKEKFLEMGCDAYVSKPIIREQLLFEIKKLLLLN